MAYTIKTVEPAHSAPLAEIEKKTGPNNFLRIMAHRPEAMQHFTQFYDAVMGPAGVLDRRLKELVYLAVSYVNECSYCASHHMKTALALGISAGEIREIEMENNLHLSMKEQAAVMFARELTRNVAVGDDARYRVQELFSTDEFVELNLVVGLANFTNRLSNGLPVPSED